LEGWKSLYGAARDFMEIRPWTWMLDSDLFGVQNPQNGELGYCCIMGNLEEFFALGVYLGSDGLASYMRMQSNDIEMYDPDLVHSQNCLMASFEDRDSLDKEDLQTIKRIGLKFRGRKAWPQFRSYLPGYVPWSLTKEEAQFLTAAIRQALDIASRFKTDSNLLTPPEEGQVLVRVPAKRDGHMEWKDTWLFPPPPKERHVPEVKIDELRLGRIKRNAKKTKGTWEIDYFYFPAPVEEGDRPFFPRTLVIADHLTGLILQTHLDHPELFFQEFQGAFLKFMEEKAILPERMLVSKYETKRLIEPITRILGIKLRAVEKLEATEEFIAEMYAQFRAAREV
jgi:hypothetical protein